MATKDLRVDRQIRAREVLVIDENNNQRGVMDTRSAVALAEEAGYSDADVDELNSILGFDSRNLPEVD